MQLGFVEFEVSDLATWTQFLSGVLGLEPVGDERFRLDDHAWRVGLVQGPADDLHCLGWEFEDDRELDACLKRLSEGGYAVEQADPSVRGTSRRYRVNDPSGVPLELVTPLPRAERPFASNVVLSRFVADDLGWGHIVLTARDKEQSLRFWATGMGVRLSDHIVTEVYGHPVDLSFFHANGRHHSVAFGGPLPKRLHHFMLEVESMDDVGLCFDRAIHQGIRIAQTLGRHPNDRMFSFYAHTPSGFQFEYGWGGREIDPQTWQSTTYDCISEWGHHPPQIAFRRKEKHK